MSDDASAADLTAIEEILQHLEAVSYVAQRDARAVLPALAPYGTAAQRRWLEAARSCFFHDRDAGKAVMRGTTDLLEVFDGLDPWLDQALAFTRWRGSDRALEGFMDQVGTVYRDWGAAGEQAWFERGLAWFDDERDNATTYFTRDYRDLAAGGALADFQAVQETAAALCGERRLPLDLYLDGARRVRPVVGTEGLLSWARHGADQLAAGRQRGEAYFKLESPESRQLLLEATDGLRTRGIQRLLQILVEVWLNQRPTLGQSEWLPGAEPPQVETDGRTLFLPAVFPSREQAILAVLHAGGHLAFDTYAESAIHALFQAAGETHPPLDADQRITWRPLFARYGEAMFRFQVLFDLAEDLRVDARIRNHVPGYLDRAVALAQATPVPPEPAGTYWRLARATLEQLAAGRIEDPDLAPLAEPEATLLDAFHVAERWLAEDRVPSLSIAERGAAYLPHRGRNAARPVYPRRRGEDEEAGPEEATDGRPSDPERRRDDPSRVPKDAAGDDPDMEIPPEETAGSGGRVGVGIPVPHSGGSGRTAGRTERHDGWPYAEWDYREQRYIPDWARVHPRPITEGDAARAEAILAEHRRVLKRLRQALQRQKPQRMAVQRYQLEGDELDLEATVGYIAEKRGGLAPKPFVYKRRLPSRRDTSVLLLADLSTSIMAKLKGGGGKVIDRLRAGLMVFAEALETVGDPYAIAGFSSKFHDGVNYYHLKDFDTRLNPSIRAALAGVSGRLASRMGAAIRHACVEFAEAPASRRLLLVLSDGRPADYDDPDGHYLREDTRMAFKEAVDQGIHPFCITLDPRGGEYLPHIFGQGHYLVIDDIHALPARLPEVYLRLRR